MTVLYYKDIVGFVSGVLSVNERYSDFIVDIGDLSGRVSSEHLDVFCSIFSCSLNVDRDFLGICEGNVKSEFYFSNDFLVRSPRMLESGFFLFTKEEFEILEYSGDVCFFKLFAEDLSEAEDFFEGVKELAGGIDVVRVVR